MTTPAAQTDLAPLLERCFFFDAAETSYEISGISGRVPEWLRGSYYVNGPARFERAGERYKHWLDGDGMVCLLRFNEDGVRFASRFVQTRKLRDEEAAGRFLYRAFGTSFRGDLLRRKVMLEPPVNVSVYRYDGRLLAFGEQTLPYELDPVTLETRGEYDFGGSLNAVSPFAAHAKFDGNLLNFGVSFSAASPMLNVYEFSGSGNLIRRRRYPIGLPHAIHDFGFTSRRAVFFLSPLLMNFQRFWDEDASVMQSLSWEPERGSRIFVAPRAGKPEEAFSVKAGAGYCLHLINCFEAGGRLTVDILELEEPVYRQYQPVADLFSDAPACRPVRYEIDLGSKTLVDRIAMSYNRTSDFPSLDTACAGLSYDDFWMLGISAAGQWGRKFFDELAHGSWTQGQVLDVFRLPPGEYMGGEPVFVANPSDPEDAVVIVQRHQPAIGASSFLLFNAFAVRNGPVATLPLRNRLHPGFHASFSKSAL